MNGDAESRYDRKAGVARMLRPRRVAIIGASERNPFAMGVIRNLERFGFPGEVALVNARGAAVAGRPTLASPSQLEGPFDAAFVCVPAAAVLDTVEAAAEAGVTGFVVVSSGFAEAGPEGQARQAALTDLAARRALALLGPNALGFINYVDGVPMCMLERENRRGTLAIVSASGSVGASLAKAAHLQGVGLSHLVLVGNEARTTIAEVLEFLVDDPDTGAIGVFAEAVRDPALFASVAGRALERGKPIVMLKVGAAPASGALALSHTGALVGDDRIFAAVAQELGIARVDTFDDLVATATLLDRTGPVAKPGFAAITVSGGAAEVLSDLAGVAGVAFPPFSEATRKQLDAVVSSFGATHNPLDVTGAAVAQADIWERSIAIVGGDERIGLTLCIWDAPEETQPEWLNAMLASIARGYRDLGPPPPLISTVVEPVSPQAQAILADLGIPGIIPGMRAAVTGLGHLTRWSARIAERRAVRLLGRSVSHGMVVQSFSHAALFDWLGRAGVPITPAELAKDADEAVRAAERAGYPVVLALASPDVQHKTDVGGVVLDLRDAAAVRRAFAAITEVCEPPLRLDGIKVSPLRDHVLELIVSISVDPTWGPMLTVGLGGVWTELLDDTLLVPLPTSRASVVAALGGLKAAPLFNGARGRPMIDVQRIADVIVAISEAGMALGPDLLLLEINPLAVWPERAEAMDAVVLWRDATA